MNIVRWMDDIHSRRFSLDVTVQFHRAFVDADRESGFDVASMRLRSGKPLLTDEGYANLLESL